MNETYVECLVQGKSSVVLKFLKILLVMLTVVFALLGMFVLPALLIALICGIFAYVVYLQADVEYEYLYVDREITIDKISAKSRRKRVGKFQVDKMEILAPIQSYHLDQFNNRKCTVMDYSSGATQPDKRYVIYYDGMTKIIFNPSEEFVKAVQNVAPRKVFMD